MTARKDSTFHISFDFGDLEAELATLELDVLERIHNLFVDDGGCMPFDVSACYDVIAPSALRPDEFIIRFDFGRYAKLCAAA